MCLSKIPTYMRTRPVLRAFQKVSGKLKEEKEAKTQILPQRILNHSSEVFIDLEFKRSSELKLSGMCVRPGEY